MKVKAFSVTNAYVYDNDAKDVKEVNIVGYKAEPIKNEEGKYVTTFFVHYKGHEIDKWEKADSAFIYESVADYKRNAALNPTDYNVNEWQITDVIKRDHKVNLTGTCPIYSTYVFKDNAAQKIDFSLTSVYYSTCGRTSIKVESVTLSKSFDVPTYMCVSDVFKFNDIEVVDENGEKSIRKGLAKLVMLTPHQQVLFDKLTSVLKEIEEEQNMRVYLDENNSKVVGFNWEHVDSFEHGEYADGDSDNEIDAVELSVLCGVSAKHFDYFSENIRLIIKTEE